MFAAIFLLLICKSALAYSETLDEECLNASIYPLQYDIIIKPYVDNGRFVYDCDITITVIAYTSDEKIIMEAKDLNIYGTVRVLKGGRDIVNQNRPYEHNKSTGKITVFLKEYLVPYRVKSQQYEIKMSFRKVVREDSFGIFVVKYLDEHQKMRYMLQTRLSPDHAKYFFPTFDNPRFESKYRFSVHVPPDTWGLFNTSIVIAEQQKQDRFPNQTLVINYEPSPQIYPYQVGFHISQFSNIRFTSKYTNDMIIVWAPAQKINYCHTFLEFSDRMLEMIRRYSMTNRSLTTGPINIVAVPKDLDGYEPASWNLLTNNEIRIVNHPQYMSVKQLERMHFELAQQLCRIWLGNPGEVLRTKWNEEWFSEGVATYLAYYFLSQYNFGREHDTKYKLPIHYYGLQMKQIAMDNDWLPETPALMDFEKAKEVNIPTRYKQFVTMKTAAILWMIENYVGSERFHSALVRYINNKRGMYISLKNFIENLDHDTVECFAGHNSSRTSVVLKSWLKSHGYPVVRVHVLRNRDTGDAIQLKQFRFSYSGHRHESKFTIPISYFIQNTTNCLNCYQPWFTMEGHAYTFMENLNGGWIILNANATGHYRVHYDENTWNLIAKTLKENILSIGEMNRAQIANDVFALFVSGDLRQDLAMRILDFLDQEQSQIVWDAVASGFEMLKIDNSRCGMTKTKHREWQLFLRKKIVTIFKILTNTVDTAKDTRLFRSSIIELACSVGYQKCLDYTELLYRQWKENNYIIDADSRQACYRAAFSTNPSLLDRKHFNAYEMDDKMAAIRSVQKEYHYVHKMPEGEPRPENMTMTTIEPKSLIASTEKSVAGPNFGVKSTAVSSLLLYNLAIIALTTFIVS